MIHFQKKTNFLRNSLLFSTLAIFSGCQLRGTPPTAPDQAPSPIVVEAPTAPTPPDDAPLRKSIQPRDGNLEGQKQGVIVLPKLRKMTAEDLINKEPFISAEPIGKIEDHQLGLSKKAKLAILDFQDQTGTGRAPGRLASDQLYRSARRVLQERMEIIDPNTVSKEVIAKFADLSTDEVTKAASKLNLADYLVVGDITSYDSETISVTLGWQVEEEDFCRFINEIDQWQKDYGVYTEAYTESYEPAYERYVKRHEEDLKRHKQYYQQYDGLYTEYNDEYYRYFHEYREYHSGLRRKAFWLNVPLFPIAGPLHILSFETIPFPWVKAKPEASQRQSTIQKEAEFSPLVEKAPLYQPEFPAAHTDSDSIYELIARQTTVPPSSEDVVSPSTVSLTMRLIHGPSSEIIWIGNASIRNLDLTKGISEICDRMLLEMLKDMNWIDARIYENVVAERMGFNFTCKRIGHEDVTY